jgi:AcrR family transcriptional regulator
MGADGVHRGSQPRGVASVNQRAKDKADTRQRIVDAALEQFRERGYENTSMGNIATAAGTSRANLYLHFSSKPLIVKERMAQLEPEVIALYNRLQTLKDFSPENLLGWLVENRKMYLDHPAEFEAISAAMSVDGEVLHEWGSLHQRIVGRQEWLMRLFPDPEEQQNRAVHLATLMMSTERVFDVIYLRHQSFLDEDRVLNSLSRQWAALFQR